MSIKHSVFCAYIYLYLYIYGILFVGGGRGRMGNPGDSDEKHFSTPGDSNTNILTLGYSNIEFYNKSECGPWGILGF